MLTNKNLFPKLTKLYSTEIKVVMDNQNLQLVVHGTTIYFFSIHTQTYHSNNYLFIDMSPIMHKVVGHIGSISQKMLQTFKMESQIFMFTLCSCVKPLVPFKL